MFSSFNKPDRRILALASIMVLVAIYFLYDDSLLLSFDDDSNQPAIGKISNLENDVRYKFAKRFAWKSARKTEAVRLGDSIFTGSGSNATIEFKDGRSLMVQPNSLVVISNVGNEMKLDLRFGSFGGKLDGCIKVDVKGKQVDICGTKSNIEVNAAGDVKVKEGSVKVANKQIEASKEEKDVLEWKIKPEENFYHTANNRYLDLSWKSKKFYSRYRVQFSKDGKFKKLSTQDTTQELSIQTKNYPRKGEFFLRIQAEDITGQAATTTEPVKINFQDLEVPRILTPLAKQVFEFKTNADGDPVEATGANISWEYNIPKVNYQLQVSDKTDFSSVTTNQETKENSAMTPNLLPGIYFARVRDNQKERPWSPVVEFEIRYLGAKEMAAPKLLTKSLEYVAPSEQKPVAKWETDEPVEKYIMETSPNPNFDPELTASFDVKSTSQIFTVKNPGKTYFRVSSISKKGRRSPASETGVLSAKIDVPVLNAIAPVEALGKSPEDQGDPIDFPVSWNDLKVADSYQIEYASKPDFSDAVQISTSTPSGTVNIPKAGEYQVRVRAMNAQGKPITEFSKPEKIKYDLKVPMASPELVEPFANVTLFFQKKAAPYVWLEWKSVRQATSYVLEVSNDPKFEKITYQKTLKETRHLYKDNVGMGKLYWRTKAIGDDGRFSFWSEPRLMTIFSGTDPSARQPAGKGKK